MDRRDLLQWAAPVIIAVSLPVHAQTSCQPEVLPDGSVKACVPDDLFPNGET